MWKKKGEKSLITGLIVGGAIASVLSLLFSSKKNRDAAKNLTRDIAHKTRITAENFLEKYKN